MCGTDPYSVRGSGKWFLHGGGPVAFARSAGLIRAAGEQHGMLTDSCILRRAGRPAVTPPTRGNH